MDQRTRTRFIAKYRNPIRYCSYKLVNTHSFQSHNTTMQSVSDPYTTQLCLPKQILPLDFESIQDVPDSHSWNAHKDLSSTDIGSVPIIDLNDPNAVKLMRHACETWGVFQLKNHGVPIELIKDVEFHCKRLFDLPMQKKLETMRLPKSFTGYGVVPSSSLYPKLLWSEAFSIVGSPVEHARQLWPDGDYIKFCDVTEEYQKEMKKLCEKLLWVMLTSLGLNNQDILECADFISGSQSLLQLNSYPVCPDPNKAMGLGPHTDSSFFTLLHQTSQGLQLKTSTGWIEMPLLENSFIVNVGDLFHILSNGRYLSCIHRAVVNLNRHRYSFAYFYLPPMNVQVSPLMKLVNSDHPCLYRPVTWNEYVGIKAKNFGKELEVIRTA